MFNSIFEQAEERIRELQDRTIEIIEPEEQEGKRMRKNKQNLRDFWDTIKWTNIHIMGFSGGEERERVVERPFEKKQWLKIPQIW